MRKKILTIFMCSILAFSSFTGCSSGQEESITKQESDKDKNGEISINVEDVITDINVEYKDKDDVTYDVSNTNDEVIEFTDDSITYSGKNADVSGNVITIKNKGTYIIKGSSKSGQIVIDAKDEKVELVLADVTLENSKNAPINVIDADKVRIILADGTENYICDSRVGEDDNSKEKTATYAEEDDTNDVNNEDTVNAAIYATCDLVVTGNGKLNVEAKYKNGIYTKDDLIITNGIIDIVSNKNALVGKDSVVIKDGDINIESKKDGIKSNNTNKADKGYVVIDGGNVEIAANDDGITADKLVKLNNGSINITKSNEGIEAKNIIINDGDVKVVATDDGINISESDYVKNNSSNSSDKVEKIPEGMKDGNRPQMPKEDFSEIPDDIKNGERPEKHEEMKNENVENLKNKFDGNFGGKGEFENVDGTLTINGGKLYVNAEGDGLDSNGNIVMNGGVVIVEGPTNNGNGAIDYNGDFTMNGGTIFAVGSAGMAQAPNKGNVNGITKNINVNSDEMIIVKNSAGKEIFSYKCSKKAQNVVFYSDEINMDEQIEVTSRT